MPIQTISLLLITAGLGVWFMVDLVRNDRNLVNKSKGLVKTQIDTSRLNPLLYFRYPIRKVKWRLPNSKLNLFGSRENTNPSRARARTAHESERVTIPLDRACTCAVAGSRVHVRSREGAAGGQASRARASMNSEVDRLPRAREGDLNKPWEVKMYTPKDMAKQVGRSPKTIRAFLRQEFDRGNRLVQDHQHRQRWMFTEEEALKLLALYGQRSRRRTI